jgi:hypothetical protein
MAASEKGLRYFGARRESLVWRLNCVFYGRP